jgi:hypothetical protein
MKSQRGESYRENRKSLRLQGLHGMFGDGRRRVGIIEAQMWH